MLKKALAFTCLTLSISANAAVVEVGDLNIINDAGNASHGLRFLDMTYSDGESKAGALRNAQLTYANARLATPSEWDDLFAAAGINYDGAGTASDAFSTGPTLVISSGANYDGGLLSEQLGTTRGSGTSIFSDPEHFGGGSLNTSRDLMALYNDRELVVLNQSPLDRSRGIGWLIVSEVPVPAAGWLFMSALLGLGALKRKKA